MPSAAGERVATMLAAQDEVSSSIQLAARPVDDVRLSVQGVGAVALPVSAAKAKRLRQLAAPARFGRGEQTLTDASVRDTWEVPLDLVEVEWCDDANLAAALEIVRDELGLPEHCRLTAELHSLLVYEKGQFFLPHQDSEKHDAMIATLVVTLPSAHTGGELVVHHLGESTVYRGLKDRISLVAFYADCRHEVRPVTSGHRITLTYNLLLHGEPAERVPEQGTVAQVATYLGEHFATRVPARYGHMPSEPPSRLVFLLDHEYTQHGLSMPRLKSTDATRAHLLRAAADLAGCETVLALTEIQEIWDAVDTADDYRGYGRSNRYRDAPERESEDDSRYEVSYLIDSSIQLTWWTDLDGTADEDISLGVADDEVCTATPTAALTPHSSEFEGYMGNYGNTLDRQYRRAAVVVWPRTRSFANRAEASLVWAVDDLLTRHGEAAGARADAASIAPLWERVDHRDMPGDLFTKSLAVALVLDDADAAAAFVRPFSVERLRPRHAAPLDALTARYGSTWTHRVLGAWFGRPAPAGYQQTAARPTWLVSLPELCTAVLAHGDHGQATARRLVELSWTSLEGRLSARMASTSPGVRREIVSLGAPLGALVRVAGIAPCPDTLDVIVTYCRQNRDALTAGVIAALRAVAPTTTVSTAHDCFVKLAADQVSRLREQLGRPTRADDDWSMAMPPGCDCQLCGVLSSFLTDPTQLRLDWPLAKDKRSHVHGRLSASELPVTHVTRRQGRPFTLVLTKTPQLFVAEAQERARDQADLDWLLASWLYPVASSGYLI